MLNVRIENSGDAVILHCRGRLVAGKEASTLYNTVVSEQGKRVVILDLRGVNRVDARGLGVLVSIKQWADDAGVRQQLIPSKPLKELLDLTGLHSLFEICSAETTPLAADVVSGCHHGGSAERRCA
jgi:anti-anti-sigma factor